MPAELAWEGQWNHRLATHGFLLDFLHEKGRLQVLKKPRARQCIAGIATFAFRSSASYLPEEARLPEFQLEGILKRSR